MGLITRLKKAFCRHEYGPEFVVGFRVVDGWMEPVRLKECKKCGKIVETGTEKGR